MSLEELRQFLYKSSNLTDLPTSNESLVRLDLAVAKLVNSDNKGDEILKEIKEYANSLFEYNCNKQLNINLDSAVAVLASCSKLNKNEQFSHSVYKTLIDISQIPTHLFAFTFYRKHLVNLNNEPNVKLGQFSGRGLKKALNKWYNQWNEKELLCLLTTFKRSHSWSNKDLFKLYHIKPKNEGINFVTKYVLFGYDKVKDEKLENDSNMIQYIKDLEDLKSLKTGAQVANLITKNKFKLVHLPSRLRKFKEIWPALLEDMNIQEFCEQIHIFIKSNTINQETENSILNRILNSDNPDIKKTNPIYPCLATQIYEQLTSLNLIKALNQTNLSDQSPAALPRPPASDSIKDALWNAFKTSVQQLKTNVNYLNKAKIAFIVDVNSQMRNDHTDGLYHLNPIDVCACIMLTSYYMNEKSSNVALFAATDKLNKFELNQAEPDLNTIETIFQGFASIDKNPNEQIFDWCLKNNETYDAFVFLSASNSNEKSLVTEMKSFREKTNKPNAKLILLNLSGRLVADEITNAPVATPAPADNTSNFNLFLKGWKFNYYFILDSFLNNKF